MSYTTQGVDVEKEDYTGTWFATIFLTDIQCDTVEECSGIGETRQDAIQDLVKEVLKMEQKHRAANKALVAFLGEDAT